MAFKYRPRSNDAWDRTANMRGSNREGYVKGQFRLYQTKKGENCIRIMPPTWDGAEQFYLDIWVHFGVGPDNASVLCNRKMEDSACPICQEITVAEKQGASEKEIGDLQPKHRTLFWMIDRKDERQGLMAWGAPWTWTRDMVKVCRNRSTGDYFAIDDPEKGYDIYFDREDKQTFPDYGGFQLASRPTSVSADAVQFVEDNPLPDILEHRTYEQVQKIFFGGALPAPREAEPFGRPPRIGRPSDEAAERPPREGLGRPSDDRSASGRPSREEKPESPPLEEGDKGSGEQKEETPVREVEAATSGSSRAASLRERFLKNREVAT